MTQREQFAEGYLRCLKLEIGARILALAQLLNALGGVNEVAKRRELVKRYDDLWGQCIEHSLVVSIDARMNNQMPPHIYGWTLPKWVNDE